MKYFVALLLLTSSFSHADVWLESSNRMAKNDLQFLSSREIIKTPITTFPIPWSAILPQLKTTKRLTLTEQAAINRLLNEYNKSLQTQVSVRVATDEYSLPAQSGRQSNDTSLSVSTSYDGDKIKAKIDADVANSEFTGSYLALEQSGWLFYLSALDQFWGPGNDSSLIYSDYALAAPTLGLQRASFKRSSLPIVKWLGPWGFKAQMAQLESDRAVPNALLWSTRFNFKPLRHLEIGLSHVAQWGGDGYSNGLDAFVDVITGEEFCVNGESSCDHSLRSKFGNQLASIDFNLQFEMSNLDMNFYGQLTGEDAPTSGLLPADRVNMFGLSSHFYTKRGLVKVYFETTDSNLSCNSNSAVQNCLYEHSVYNSGYRYEGIPIGSQYDNDSTSHVFGLTLTNAEHFVEMKLKHLTLNEDSSNANVNSEFGGHYLVDEETRIILLEYSHQYNWSDNQRVSLELQSKLDGSLEGEDDHILNLSYQHYF